MDAKKRLQSKEYLTVLVTAPTTLLRLEVGASCSRPDTARYHRLSPGVPRFFCTVQAVFHIPGYRDFCLFRFSISHVLIPCLIYTVEYAVLPVSG